MQKSLGVNHEWLLLRSLFFFKKSSKILDRISSNRTGR